MTNDQVRTSRTIEKFVRDMSSIRVNDHFRPENRRCEPAGSERRQQLDVVAISQSLSRQFLLASKRINRSRASVIRSFRPGGMSNRRRSPRWRRAQFSATEVRESKIAYFSDLAKPRSLLQLAIRSSRLTLMNWSISLSSNAPSASIHGSLFSPLLMRPQSLMIQSANCDAPVWLTCDAYIWPTSLLCIVQFLYESNTSFFGCFSLRFSRRLGRR